MIEEKLQKCRVELQKKKLKKSGENKFAKFKYYELADFIPAINQLFAENKMFSNFSICGDTATLTITDCEDKSYQTFTSNIADGDVKGCTAIQSLGAVHTYLKRYLYQNALEIVESDMLDGSFGSENFEPKQKTVKDDTSVYIALTKIDDIETLKSYYNANKELVKDRKQLYEMVQQRLEAIKKIKEEFDEVA